MDLVPTAGRVEQILRDIGLPFEPVRFDPRLTASTTTVAYRGAEVEIGTGVCEEGNLDLLVSVALGALPAIDREAALMRLLEWNHCTSGIGHFSLSDDTVYLVSRHALDGLDPDGLLDILGRVTAAAIGAAHSIALEGISAGVVVA